MANLTFDWSFADLYFGDLVNDHSPSLKSLQSDHSLRIRLLVDPELFKVSSGQLNLHYKYSDNQFHISQSENQWFSFQKS